MNGPLFFSTFVYSECKVTGWTSGQVLMYETRGGVPTLDASTWAGWRTLGQACRLCEVLVHCDGGTYITKSRCIAAGEFLHRRGKDCDVWLTCDDDMYADQSVLKRLVYAARATRGLVALPYLNRDGHSMTFRKVKGPTVWLSGHEIPLRTVDRVGMGLVAMHRSFVQHLDRECPPDEHFDGNPGIFLEGVRDGGWIGEDYWLCRLAERLDLPMHVLLDAPGEHAGKRAKLDLEGRILVMGDDVHAELEKGLRAADASQNPQDLRSATEPKEN